MHITFSCSAALANPIPASFHLSVLNALVRLRYTAPTIACTMSRLPDYSYEFKYEVPSSLDAALTWAASVVFIHEESLSFEEAHTRVMDTVWWKASDGRYTHELHIYPNPVGSDSWTFTQAFIIIRG